MTSSYNSPQSVSELLINLSKLNKNPSRKFEFFMKIKSSNLKLHENRLLVANFSFQFSITL